jgi:hypothetical protein
MCDRDSTARPHLWIQKDWPPLENPVVSSKNIAHPSLVAPSKVILPPLHIKLGVMKQFVKALNKGGHCFKYMCQKYTALTEANLKEGIYTGPDFRKLMPDATFESTVNATEHTAWQAFRDVVTKFLVNTNDPNCTNAVNKVVDAFNDLGCNMSLKLHILHSHRDYFPENLGSLSEEQGERFHKDVKEIESRYQGRSNVNMLADYRSMLKREVPKIARGRKGARRTFTTKKQRLQ